MTDEPRYHSVWFVFTKHLTIPRPAKVWVNIRVMNIQRLVCSWAKLALNKSAKSNDPNVRWKYFNTVKRLSFAVHIQPDAPVRVRTIAIRPLYETHRWQLYQYISNQVTEHTQDGSTRSTTLIRYCLSLASVRVDWASGCQSKVTGSNPDEDRRVLSEKKHKTQSL